MPNAVCHKPLMLLALAAAFMTVSAHAEPTGAAAANAANAPISPQAGANQQAVDGGQPSETARTANTRKPPAGAQSQGFSFGVSNGGGQVGTNGLSAGRQAPGGPGGSASVIAPTVTPRANQISWSGSDGDDVCERGKSCKARSAQQHNQRPNARSRRARKP